MKIVADSNGQKPIPKADGVYDDYLKRINDRFSNLTNDRPLFMTAVEDLFATFLAALPDEERQYHDCNCCRHFINRYGGLVVVNKDGELTSPIWDMDTAPEPYRSAVAAMLPRITSAKIATRFYAEVPLVGTPVTGPWSHYHLYLTVNNVAAKGAKLAYEQMAEKLEEYGMARRAVGELNKNHIGMMLAVLKTDDLNRADKFLGPAKWICTAKEIMGDKNSKRRENKFWLHVATAPKGYAHIKSGMLGTLLDDIKAELDLPTIKKRFNEKMHPLSYQRPQAPPSAGNIASAEKIVEKLGIKKSLRRRPAHMSEIQMFWKPEATAKNEVGGVFDHLKQKPKSANMVAGTKKISLEKFLEKVLPTAKEMTLRVDKARMPFIALTSAVDPEAPIIFHWNNPVAWYLYHGGSAPRDFCVSDKAKITGLCRQPNEWEPGHEHVSKGVVFLLEGCREIKAECPLALFPSFMRSDLHEIRSTIEEFSHKGHLEPATEEVAAGVVFQASNGQNPITIEVNDGTAITAVYELDRWE